MKIGIVSDTHGALEPTRSIFSFFEKEGVELIIHVGDVLYHGPRNPIPPSYNPAELARFLSNFNGNLILIKGNCDSDVDEMVLGETLPPFFALYVNELSIIASHIRENMVVKRYNLYIFGHTHIPTFEKKENFLFLNPGSPSLPKENHPPTFSLLDISKGEGYIFNAKDFNPWKEFRLR